LNGPMRPPAIDWQLKPQQTPPDWLIALIQERLPSSSGQVAAQLLWQRGLRDPEVALAFLDSTHYQPASAWAFGVEMEQAVARLQQARDRQETVFIWGDFDADGITATAVLWEGLGQFFVPNKTLYFTIPNRLSESHGLSKAGIKAIAAQGAQLIVTCDTGSADQAEIEYAQQLGIDVIITDHHTLPSDRPTVAAFLNPRTFPVEHPLANLSGVAVAYKLIEALYDKFPQIPEEPLEQLLDLVAIGLIADLVKLTGDCRYLAQQGLLRLKQQLEHPTRPGIAKLLKLCRKNGDRPSDIAFGLGPRINAISRIHGDARDGVELLTSRDPIRAGQLAEAAEWTNVCRKEVQERVLHEAKAQLNRLDLEATAVIVLNDPQWPVGILGLVASHLAQTYGRPAILLSQAETTEEKPQILRGSARSVMGIDLYGLLGQQAHLMHRFGGHPLAAGLSLPAENLPLFTASINQSFRQHIGQQTAPALEIDLDLCLADMVPNQGADLFRELLQLEPYGMGNPAPRILLRNCWLENRRSSGYQTVGDRKLRYQKTQFHLRDESTSTLFPGIWWGHRADELPTGCCDVVVELDHGQFRQQSHYHARLVAIRPTEDSGIHHQDVTEPWLLDWRQQSALIQPLPEVLPLPHSPKGWEELEMWAQQATTHQQKLALAYQTSVRSTAALKWQQLVGLVKYAARTGHCVTLTQIQERLAVSERSLLLGIAALKAVGFDIAIQAETMTAQEQPRSLAEVKSTVLQTIQHFLDAVAEEHFQQEYFQRAPVAQLQQILEQRLQR
jgi:single-stranded-DNA-specific exonuclease